MAGRKKVSRRKPAPKAAKASKKPKLKPISSTTPTMAAKLQRAVVSNKLDEVRLLLDRGVDPNVLVKNTSTLAWAVYHGHDATAELLLERGANPNIGTSYPAAGGAMHAAAKKARLELLPALLDRGGDPNAPGQNNGRPLQAAISSRNARMVQALIEAGARPELPDAREKTAWEAAAASDNLEILELVVATDPARVTEPFANGWTLLHYAAYMRGYTLVDYLVKHGLAIDVRATSGQTPLHVAAWRDDAKMVELLLARGADRTAVVEGQTALDVANNSGSSKAARLLKS